MILDTIDRARSSAVGFRASFDLACVVCCFVLLLCCGSNFGARFKY